LFKQLEIEKQKRASVVLERMKSLREKHNHLENVTLLVHLKLPRSYLARAEVALNEVQTLYKKEQYPASEEKLKEVEVYLAKAENATAPVLNRYRDTNQIARWKRWATETIEESRKKTSTASSLSKPIRNCCFTKMGLVEKLSGWLGSERLVGQAASKRQCNA